MVHQRISEELRFCFAFPITSPPALVCDLTGGAPLSHDNTMTETFHRGEVFFCLWLASSWSAKQQTSDGCWVFGSLVKSRSNTYEPVCMNRCDNKPHTQSQDQIKIISAPRKYLCQMAMFLWLLAPMPLLIYGGVGLIVCCTLRRPWGHSSRNDHCE